MLTTTALVIAFVVIGLTVVFVAFTGGRGERRRRGAPSRAARRLVWVVSALVIVAIGVVVPVLVGVFNKETQASSAPGGVELTAAQRDGRSTFAKYCGMCHTLRAANAVGRVGPNLDQLRPPKALTLDAIAKGRARGQGQMPAGVVDGEDAENVADFVAAVAGR